jgi:Brp/Blh family beta-carotene 15,15'-monooxygenase
MIGPVEVILKAGIGAPSKGVPVPWLFWPAAIVSAFAAFSGAELSTNMLLVGAASLMLLTGLPHGAYDIAVAMSLLRLKRVRAAIFVGAYLLVAAAKLALWLAAPVAALCLFLAFSAVHFGDDWRMLESGLLRTLAGAAVLCVPAFAHPEAVTVLFVAMAGPEAEWVRRVFITLTPVAVLVTSVGMWIAWENGNAAWVRAQAGALAALALLPPQIGFLLYFGFLHSPLHMREVVAALPSWSGFRFWICGIVVCAVCLIATAAIAPGFLSGQAETMSAEAFRLLSVLAAPHLILTLYTRRVLAR